MGDVDQSETPARRCLIDLAQRSRASWGGSGVERMVTDADTDVVVAAMVGQRVYEVRSGHSKQAKTLLWRIRRPSSLVDRW